MALERLQAAEDWQLPKIFIALCADDEISKTGWTCRGWFRRFGREEEAWWPGGWASGVGCVWLRGTLWFQPFRIDGFEALYYGKVADGD